MTRRTKLILGSVGGLLLAVVAFIAYATYQTTHVNVPNAYAVWWTADLLIDHMERHEGAWPQGWEELRATGEQAYEGTVSTNRNGAMIAEFRPRASIEELQERVEIDWSADPAELVKADFKDSGPPFRVIRLRNGKSTHYSGKEPNAMVLEYLKWKAIDKVEPTPAQEPSPGATGQDTAAESGNRRM